MGLSGFKSRRFKALLVLLIILPVTLIAVFELTGILGGEESIETVMLPLKEWSFPRPTSEFDVLQTINGSFVDSQISFLAALEVISYNLGLMEVPPCEWLRFALSINASTFTGYIQRIEILFRDDVQPSQIWILKTSIMLKNLTLTSFKWTKNPEAFEKFHITLLGKNRPREAAFQSIGEWSLLDTLPDTRDHQLEILCTLTFYNGTSYKKIVQPFKLNLDADRHILVLYDAFIGGGKTLSINISIDNVTYQTPMTVFVTNDTHEISFPQYLEANSTIYQLEFIIAALNKNYSGDWYYWETPNIKLNVQRDMYFRAYYKKTGEVTKHKISLKASASFFY